MALSLLLGKYRGSSLPSSFNKLRSFSSKSFFFSQPTYERKALLEVNDLTAVNAESKQEVLKGVSFLVREGELHMMNYRGPGNNVLLKVIFGDPQYKVTGGSIRYRGFDLLGLTTGQRSSSQGLMSFNPIPHLDEDERLGSCTKGGKQKKKHQALCKELQVGVLGIDLGVLDGFKPGFLALAEIDAALKGMYELMVPQFPCMNTTRFANKFQFTSVSPWFTHMMVDGKMSSPPPQFSPITLPNVSSGGC